MIDALVTISADTPEEWVRGCVASISDATRATKLDIKMIAVPGVPGHIGEAMRNGLARSKSEYVCWIDDDDYVLPSAFASLESALQSKPPAVCAREIDLYANSSERRCFARHHLTVYRRDWLDTQNFASFRAIPNSVLLANLPPETVDVEKWVYVRRVRLSGGMRLRAQFKQEEILSARRN